MLIDAQRKIRRCDFLLLQIENVADQLECPCYQLLGERLDFIVLVPDQIFLQRLHHALLNERPRFELVQMPRRVC